MTACDILPSSDALLTKPHTRPVMNNLHSGSRQRDADAAAAEVLAGDHTIEKISDAVAEVEPFGARSRVVEQLHVTNDGRPEAPPASSQPTDLGRLVLAGARSRLLTEIVDSLAEGTQFIALTGVPGVGKTIMAAAIREELSKRAGGVRWVDGGGGSGIRLRTIMSQVLGKLETDIDDGDIEQLFDAMTEREATIQRLVLIIDDAEQLLPDAIGYLRLLASVAMERMPQILFVGDPSFWETADHAAQAGFGDLIKARFELEPLNRREVCAAAQRLMSALSPARRPVFDADALDEVVQRADGLISRLFPLVAAIQAVATETDQIRVTTAVIDAAVVRLEGGLDSLAPPSPGDAATATMAREFVCSTSEDGCAEAIGATGALVPIPPRRGWKFARMSGAAVALVGGLGLAAYWLTPFGIDRISAETRTALEDPNARGEVSPDKMIIIRLPATPPSPHALDIAQFIAAPDDVRPPALSVPLIDTAAAVRRPSLRRGAEARAAPSVFVTRSSRGVWLFPPNPNG